MEVINLKVKHSHATKNQNDVITNAFIESCKALNPSIFEPYINEDIYFEELDKYRFLQSLKDVFTSAKQKGNTSVSYLKEGYCRLCNCEQANYEFYNKEGLFLFAYFIEQKENITTDIYACRLSSGNK